MATSPFQRVVCQRMANTERLVNVCTGINPRIAWTLFSFGGDRDNWSMDHV